MNTFMGNRLKPQPSNAPDSLSLALANAFKEAIETKEHRTISAEEFGRILGAIDSGPEIREGMTCEEYEFAALSDSLAKGVPYDAAARDAALEAGYFFENSPI